MTSGKASGFTAALVQMRSGLTPDDNLASAIKLIEQATKSGADYVQTPEMTNILALKREQLFGVIVDEDDDKSLAAFRDVARKHGIYLHVGSLAIKVSPDKAANRSFLIGRNGDDPAPATTRFICSTSTSPTARATANRATTAR